ncbi:VanW family protein [Paenibacillus sp.]|jgi:vancomycin resistance protein VanW|uniref:VanW family protein n=1 Tax=Paenibacillus sp. TaxID=58172 RepID=UPI002818D76D|nr:VanW family protein [Paenibacillus sp.]MDR0269531.1 VanW family protein [Paenibacillus sp.]
MKAIKKVLVKLPFAYALRIQQLRLIRNLENQSKSFSVKRTEDKLPYTMKRHQSLLRRKLGSSDPRLQENKVVNLGIAINRMNGVVVRPGETFSYWKLVGKPTKRKGYIEGLQLSRGEVRTGVGGGLCQLANLLYWLALHSPLEVAERHHHSFDPFPDDHRVLPFGSGASVFYNYVDLRFYNPTSQPFQFNIWLTEDHLKGTLYCGEKWPFAYHIEERNHQFHTMDGKNFRENEIWRRVVDKKTGLTVKEELLVHNYSEVKYEISAAKAETAAQQGSVTM